MAQENEAQENKNEYLNRFIPAGVTKQIVDNTVDSYYSYTYKLTWSMLPFSFHQQQTADLNLDGTGASGKRIIIAQTGVTKFQIDNLQISSVVSKTAPKNLRGNKIFPFILSFSLTEPFGMSFIDLLHRTMYELNKDLKLEKIPPVQQMPFLLEIELIGQKDNIENSSKSEELGEVFYHNVYPVRIIDFDLDVGKQGTNYEVRCVPMHNFAPVADTSVEKVPEELRIKGSTVNELLADFSSQMKDKQQSIQTQKSDNNDNNKPGFDIGEYKLASHGMPSLPDIFNELKIDDEYTDNLDVVKIKETTGLTIAQVKEKDTSGQADSADDANSKKVITVDIPKDKNVEDVMISLAGLNSDFCKHCTRYDVPPESSEFDPKTLDKDKTQYLIPDVYVTTSWDGKSFKADNKLAMTYTYNLTGKLDSSIVIDPVELNLETKKEQQASVTKAAIDRNVSKFYAFTYTGLNDQIIDVDLKQEYGIRYLYPGKGGKQSNYTLSPAASPSKKSVNKSNEAINDQSAVTDNEILDKFAKIASELKSTITSLAMLPITITQDLAALAKGNKPDGISSKVGKVRMVNARLPSSPVAVLQKLESVTNLTSEVSALTNSITELQEQIQGTISETIDGQISKIMSKAFTPFAVIDSKLNAIGAGINDFIDKIEETTGNLGIDQFGINTNALLDEAREAAEQATAGTGTGDTETTPPGFNPGSTSVNQAISTMTETYMEEYEFDQNDTSALSMSNPADQPQPFGVADTSFQEVLNRETGLIGPASKFANRSIFSTMLSNTRVGAPYMVRTSLQIKGDPYWLGMPIDSIKNKKYTMKQGQQYFGDLENDVGTVRDQASKTNTAPYGIGEVSFFFAYLFPREYDTWADDTSLHTGEMKDLSMNQSFSGQFQVYQVQHEFSGGKFTQTLNAFKQIYKGQFPEFDPGVIAELAENKKTTEVVENNLVDRTLDVSEQLAVNLEKQFNLTPEGIVDGTEVRGTGTGGG